jgi:hypothetical protein
MEIALKPGARLRSVTCTTEVVVVHAEGDGELRCGGESMVDIASDENLLHDPVSGFDEGTQIGKRYVDETSSLEVLCTKAGSGSLSLGELRLTLKGAKPLPASD